MITVYTINDCIWCRKVKKYLLQKNIDFKEINIEEDQEAATECERISGGVTVPVTTDGNLVAVSFQKSIIDQMIENNKI